MIKHVQLPSHRNFRGNRSGAARKGARQVTALVAMTDGAQKPIHPWTIDTTDADAGEDIPQVVPRTRESADPLSLYMREAGVVPLLTLEEEVALAKRIKRGDKAAREHMIRANLRLVVKIARDYEGFGLPLLDLISEGNIGLMRAVEKFDPNKGAKLSTYAALWIKQQMRRALAGQTKTIRLPVHMVDKVARMRRAMDEHQETHGVPPTDEQLAEQLGTTVKKVRLMRMSSMRTSSLDANVGDSDSQQLSELVPDQGVETAYEELEKKTSLALMSELLRTLSAREATIITMRFGLDGNRERTLEEIGERLGVTRERIRQLQNEALVKLRRLMEQRNRIAIAA